MGSVNGLNGVNGHTNGTSGFTLKDATVENLRPLRVVMVGAGFSGICAAIRLVSRASRYQVDVLTYVDQKNTREITKYRLDSVREE
jgi:hypothetical protein